jgi:predicted nucleotidyltransferase
MRTLDAISSEEMATYREGARRRHQAEVEALRVREDRARGLAREAASLLREHFTIERIVLFGSLIHPGSFTKWSDVDVAAWGLQPRETFKAIGMVMDLDQEIMVNLVDMDCCKPSIREVIEREGIDL